MGNLIVKDFPRNRGREVPSRRLQLTPCWRGMDSNYWSGHRETPPRARHVVPAHGSTSSERH